MLISELTVYDFLREKINLSESDARRYAKELAFAEEKLRADIKVTISEEMTKGDYATKKDIKDLEAKLEVKIVQLETKIEKGFKDILIWVVSAMVVIAGLTVAVLRFFSNR